VKNSFYIHSPAGGTERVTASVACYLADHGYEVGVITMASEEVKFYPLYPRVCRVLKSELFEILVKQHARCCAGYDKLPKNVQLVKEQDASALVDWADVIMYW
jgi:hypothetical protein